jgi:hypothetical protein
LSKCYDTHIVGSDSGRPQSAYFTGVALRSPGDAQTTSLFLCSVVDATLAPNRGYHLRLLLKKQTDDAYDLSVCKNQDIHGFATSASNKKELLKEGLSASQVDELLAQHREKLIEQLKRALSGSAAGKQRESEQLKKGDESEYWGGLAKRQNAGTGLACTFSPMACCHS